MLNLRICSPSSNQSVPSIFFGNTSTNFNSDTNVAGLSPTVERQDSLSLNAHFLSSACDHSPVRRKLARHENRFRFLYPKTFTTFQILFIIITNFFFFVDLITDCILIHAFNRANVPRVWTRWCFLFLLGPWVVLWVTVTHHILYRNPKKRPLNIRIFIFFPFSIVVPLLWKIFIDCKQLYHSLRYLSTLDLPPFPSKEEIAIPLMSRIFNTLFHSFPMLIYQICIFTIAVDSDFVTGELSKKFTCSISFSLCNIMMTLFIIVKQSIERYFETGFDFILEYFAGGLTFIPHLRAIETGHSRVLKLVGYYLEPIAIFDILKAISPRKKELTLCFSHHNFALEHIELYEKLWKRISEKSQTIFFLKFKSVHGAHHWFEMHDLDRNGVLSKEEFEDVFRWWESIAGPDIDVPLLPLRHAIYYEDIVLTEFFVHPYEMNWHQKLQFPVVDQIFSRIYKNALKGVPEREKDYIRMLTPDSEMSDLTEERSVSLIKRKNEWTRAKIIHSKLHLSFVIEYRLMRVLTLHECHINVEGMGKFNHRLRELYIKSCYLSKLSVLNNFKKLEKLKLQKIEDLQEDCEFLDLPALRDLKISGDSTNFQKLSVLTHLFSIETLVLQDCDRLHTEGIIQALYFPVLEELYLSGSNFDRLYLLDGLTSLKTLHLKKCQSLTTEGLDYLYLPCLERIFLNESSFDRVSVLAKLNGLHVLHLQHCKSLKVDLTDTLYFPHLYDLDVTGTPFCRLEVLRDLPRLKRLVMTRCENLITKHLLAPLMLPNLESLDIRSSSFHDIWVLDDLPIKTLKLASCQHLSTVGCKYLNLPNIKRLELYGSNFDRMELFQYAHSLEVMDLETCQNLNTIGCSLFLHPKLMQINLSKSSFDNIMLLAELPALKRLNLEGCKNLICNPEDKFVLPVLEWICLSDSSFTYISIVNGLPNLREIHFHGCQELSTEGIEELDLPSLEELDFSFSNFDKVRLITGLPNLKILNLMECKKLSTVDCETLNLPMLQEMNISGSNFDDLTILSSADLLESLSMKELEVELKEQDINALQEHCLKRLSCDWAIKKLLPQDFSRKIERRLSGKLLISDLLLKSRRSDVSEAELFTEHQWQQHFV